MTSKKKYATTFNKSYTEDFPCISSSKKGNTFAFCSVCCTDFSILHRGRGDIVCHINREKHQALVRTIGDNKKIDFLQKKDDYSVIRAECLFTAFLVEHNISISSADHVAPLLRKMFPDSQIAKKYGCARTKTTAIVNEMAQTSRLTAVELAKKFPFAIFTDGSNKGDKKMYPIVISCLQPDRQIGASLLSVPVLEGDATGENIASLLLSVIKSNEIPLENCLALGTDNAPVMIGKKAGVAGILMKEMPHLYVQGCLCHLINLAAEKSAACLPINIEDSVIGIYYYLDKSAKRLEKLKKLQMLCDVEVRKILKHVSTRWLSLSRCLRRLVDQWDPLTSFFKDEVNNKLKCEDYNKLDDFKIPKLNAPSTSSKPINSIFFKKRSKDVELPKPKKQKISNVSSKENADDSKEGSNALSREERLFMFLSSDLNKAFVHFLLNALPVFDQFNVALQANFPKIHKLRRLLLEMFKQLLSRFVIADVIKTANSILDVNYSSKNNQKSDLDLVVGQASSNIVSSLSQKKQALFYLKVREYYAKACDYMRLKFPFKDDVISNAEVADLDIITKTSFTNIKFFVERFPGLAKTLNIDNKDLLLDSLQSQFCALQIEDLPDNIKSEERMDLKWIELMKFSNDKYGLLCEFMLSILTLPHSNAECERVFSYVTKTQTQFRSQLSSQSLENLLILKTNMKDQCFEQNFTPEFLKKAKSAATFFNSNT